MVDKSDKALRRASFPKQQSKERTKLAEGRPHGRAHVNRTQNRTGAYHPGRRWAVDL